MFVKEYQIKDIGNKECQVMIENECISEGTVDTEFAKFEMYSIKDVSEDDNKLILSVETPNVLWLEQDQIECVGYNSYSADELNGFVSFKVGESFETRDIYVDVFIEIEGNKPVLTFDGENNYFGKGYRGIPVKIPEKSVENIKQLSFEKIKEISEKGWEEEWDSKGQY